MMQVTLNLFIAGGIIPAEDIVSLKQMGVEGIFPHETNLPDIVNFVKKSG